MYDDYGQGAGCEDPAETIKAIRQVMAELGPIPKGETAPAGSGNYRYRGIESITAKLQPLLAKHGIVISPHSRVVNSEPSPSMPNGWVDTTLSVHWRIYGPDGSWITANTSGIGRDKSDKGANKAQTQAYKYLLLELFCIADGEADSDGLEYESHVQYEAVSGTVQRALMERIGSLSEESRMALTAWFHDHEVPAIRKLTTQHLDAVDAIIEHFENLDDAKTAEMEGGLDGPDGPEPG